MAAHNSTGRLKTASRRDGDETRVRLLNVAEELFSIRGFHGTSLRDVANAGACGVALVKYHFDTKESLFASVVERRSQYMMQARMTCLETAKERAKDRPLRIEELVSGYVGPFIERSASGDEGWKNYSLFIARHANSPEFSTVIGEHYDPVAKKYLEELARTFPTMSEKDRCYAFSFMVGAMVSIVAQPGRVEGLSNGQIRAEDVEEAFRRMLPFLSAGFKALKVPAS